MKINIPINDNLKNNKSGKNLMLLAKKIAGENGHNFSAEELAALKAAEESIRQESIAEDQVLEILEYDIKDELRQAIINSSLSSLSIEQLAQALELIFNIEPVEYQDIIRNKPMDKTECSEALMADNILLNNKTRIKLIEQLSKHLGFKTFTEKEQPELWQKMIKIYGQQIHLTELSETELKILKNFLSENISILPVLKKKEDRNFYFKSEQDILVFIQKLEKHLVLRSNKLDLAMELHLTELLELLEQGKIQKVIAELKKMEIEKLLAISKKIFDLPDSKFAAKLLGYINKILENKEQI